MNKLLGSLCLLLFWGSAWHSAFAQELNILHTNDVHSKLTGYGPEGEYSPMVTGNDKTEGGFARLATLMKQAKTKAPEKTLILDAGDFLMGSLFHVAEEETGFQLNLMKKIGYEYITFGNHEFDFGVGTIAKIIKTAKANGAIPQFVASNMVFDPKSTDDDELQTLFTDQTIKPYVVITKNGLKIAIIGALGIDAWSVAPASKPLSFPEPAKILGKLVKFLKTTEKADIVILLSHSGFYPNEQGGGYYGEDLDLAKKIPAIDIILSGHTHVKTPEFIQVGTTYIVQTGAYAANLGNINLKFENGKIAEFKFNLIPVDDSIEGDAEVNDMVNKQIEFINQKYLSGIGLTYSDVAGKTNFDVFTNYAKLKESNMGSFVADANMFYLKNKGMAPDFCLVSAGTIREDLPKGMQGIITVPDAFRVMSLGKGYDNVPGYPLAQVYVTGHEVKKLMEILTMMRNKGGDGYLYFSGIKVSVNSDKGFLKKVQKVEIDGKAIDISKKNTKLYSIAANSYLLSFIGRIKEMSKGLVVIVPKDKNGMPVTDMQNQLIDIDANKTGTQEGKEWIALFDYIRSFPITGSNVSVIPDSYKQFDTTVIDLKK
ncbi:MAG TPA: hypothetical protein DCQ31_10125 [Bacteroidales bacterium]|nr:hypothetical protein [Bacteroidales bacterium]